MSTLVNKGIIGSLPTYPQEMEVVTEWTESTAYLWTAWDISTAEDLLFTIQSFGALRWYDITDIEDPSFDDNVGVGPTYTPCRAIKRHTDGVNNDHVVGLSGDTAWAMNMDGLTGTPYKDFETGLENWLNDGIALHYTSDTDKKFALSASGADRVTLIGVDDCTDPSDGITLDDSEYQATDYEEVGISVLYDTDHVVACTKDGIAIIDISGGTVDLDSAFQDNDFDGGRIAGPNGDYVYVLSATNDVICSLDVSVPTSTDETDKAGEIAVPSDTVFVHMPGSDYLFCLSPSVDKTIFLIDVSDPTDMFVYDRMRAETYTDYKNIIAFSDQIAWLIPDNASSDVLIIKVTPDP